MVFRSFFCIGEPFSKFSIQVRDAGRYFRWVDFIYLVEKVSLCIKDFHYF